MEPELLNRWSQVRILLGALTPLKRLQKPKKTLSVSLQLATRRGDVSDAWYVLVNSHLPHCLHFTRDQFQSYFSSLMEDEAKNRLALSKDPLVALSTYTRADVLRLLNRSRSTY
jgi:hypothetical protein